MMATLRSLTSTPTPNFTLAKSIQEDKQKWSASSCVRLATCWTTGWRPACTAINCGLGNTEAACGLAEASFLLAALGTPGTFSPTVPAEAGLALHERPKQKAVLHSVRMQEAGQRANPAQPSSQA